MIVTMIVFYLVNTIHLSDSTVIICISDLPCGTKSLPEVIFLVLAIFCDLQELIFEIRTDWFFLLGIILTKSQINH